MQDSHPTSRPRLSLASTLLTGLLLAAATLAIADLTPEERDCQNAIAKAAAAYVKAVHGAELRCANNEARGRECDAERRERARDEAAGGLAADIDGGCASDETVAALGFPGACSDANGAPFTRADLAACIEATHGAAIGEAVTTEYPGADASLEGSAYRCQKAIGSEGKAFLVNQLDDRRRCVDAQLRDTAATEVDCGAAGAATGDPKTDEALTRDGARLADRLAGKCAEIALEDAGFPGACEDAGAPFTADDLVACIAVTHEKAARRLLAIEHPSLVTVTTTTSTTSTTTTSIPSTTLADLTSLADLITPEGDLDDDGYSNALELGSCSNPALAESTPANDSSMCVNATIFSDTLGDAWGNTDKMTEPTYHLAVNQLAAYNTLECGAYCATTPNIGSAAACVGPWPYTGVPEHRFYEDGETVEVNFPDESGNRLSGRIFLPPGVVCTPDDEPVCDGVTDGVTCTAPAGRTYPAVVICDGFIGAQQLYYWAGHRLAADGYIAITFDVSGQGRSQGAFPNGDAGVAADLSSMSGFSRDIGAALNFVVSEANPVRSLLAVDPVTIENQSDLGADHSESYVLGLAGHSAGATAAIAYQQSTEPLYPVRARAVVAWSHFDAAGTIGNVPVQLHSGDEDNGFIQPPGSGNLGPEMQARYDRLAGDRNLDGTPDFMPRDRQIVMMEAGTHLSYSQVPWAYYPTWSEEVQYHYTLAWFDKYLRGDVARAMSGVTGGRIESVDRFADYAECTTGAGCFTATERLQLDHAHLSSTWCSRYDLGGTASENMHGGACSTR